MKAANRFSNNNRRAAENTARGFVTLLPLPIIVLMLTIVQPSCDLFMPPIGFPEDGANIRTTPQGTLEYLVRAYEHQRIDWFTELLPKNGTYRFFISPDYNADYLAAHGTDALIERIGEDDYAFIRAGTYYYWGHDCEIRKHRQLFNRADKIEFSFPNTPEVNEQSYRITAENETTHVEVRARLGELCVTAKDTLHCTPRDGQTQVFLLEREIDRRTGRWLWVIKDWFDLNTI